MTTTKEQVAEAMQVTGDAPDDLICLYRHTKRYGEGVGDLIRCTFAELPEREFDEGYGGVEGEPVICFSERYVYIKGCYDGAEWVQAIPRNPENVTLAIPIVGGG